jgi:iron complex outermembrane receptor protein
VLEIGGGNQEISTSLRYGGQVTDDMTYRVYAKAFSMQPFDIPGEGNAHDGWSKPQGGFRLDWTPGTDSLTFQGDLYAGAENQYGNSDQLISGGNLEARWNHPFADGSNLQVLGYYDQTRRSQSDGGGSFTLRTYDIEVEHSFTLGDWNKIVWGVGDRVNAYRTSGAIFPASSLWFSPAERTLNLANLFAEDTMTLTNRVQLTAGLKLEDDPYSGLSPMPSIRISWKPFDSLLLWTAASRAVRAPTPLDVDVIETLYGQPYLVGSPNFRPEVEEAFELGLREQITPALSLSVSGFGFRQSLQRSSQHPERTERQRALSLGQWDRWPCVRDRGLGRLANDRMVATQRRPHHPA